MEKINSQLVEDSDEETNSSSNLVIDQYDHDDDVNEYDVSQKSFDNQSTSIPSSFKSGEAMNTLIDTVSFSSSSKNTTESRGVSAKPLTNVNRSAGELLCSFAFIGSNMFILDVLREISINVVQSQKRNDHESSIMEPSTKKRASAISNAMIEKLKKENNQLKKEMQMYKDHWMRKFFVFRSHLNMFNFR